jgi:mRNA degradation ribonuclease J1/J2
VLCAYFLESHGVTRAAAGPHAHDEHRGAVLYTLQRPTTAAIMFSQSGRFLLAEKKSTQNMFQSFETKKSRAPSAPN